MSRRDTGKGERGADPGLVHIDAADPAGAHLRGQRVAAPYPGQELYVIRDIYATRKHAEVRALQPKNPRVTLHFTRRDARGSTWSSASSRCHPSGHPPRLLHRSQGAGGGGVIGAFIDHRNGHPVPFTWTKDPEETLAAIKRANTKANVLITH